MTLVWDIPLSCSQKLVLLKLADNAHDDGLSARPGVSTIAAQCGLSIRTVQYALRDLEQVGLIAATQFGAGGRGLVTEYRLFLKKGATGAQERVQLVRENPEKGATSTHKGATGALARVPYEPSRTVTTGADAPPNSTTPDSTQNLVAFYVDQCTTFGWEPLTKWRNQIARQIADLRSEKPIELIRSALRVAADEHKSPSALPHVVADLEAGRSGNGKSA
jgi:predicted transcriptional regulator